MTSERSVVALCGKGGVGKTVVTALLARALLEGGVAPLLLVDADPVGGLLSAIGETVPKTLGDVRREIIRTVAEGEAGTERIAHDLDYLLLEALAERGDHALIAMGRSGEKGCFCPVNTLLRQALATLATPYRVVLIDAEAGLEQINREVTREVTHLVVVVDGSQRSLYTLQQISVLARPGRVSAVANRGRVPRSSDVTAKPGDFDLVGTIPEDDLVRRFDRDGRSLWDLPDGTPALVAAREVALALGLTRRETRSCRSSR